MIDISALPYKETVITQRKVDTLKSPVSIGFGFLSAFMADSTPDSLVKPMPGHSKPASPLLANGRLRPMVTCGADFGESWSLVRFVCFVV